MDATDTTSATSTDTTSVGPTVSTDTTVTTSTSGPDTTTTVGPGTDTSCGDDGVCLDLPPPTCPDTPGFACSAPLDCEPGVCGGTFSQFDENGCLRRSCGDDGDCEGGEVCFRPQDFGGCASSDVFCDDNAQGECVCGGNPDCSGSYCLPPELVPPSNCAEILGEDECIDAGCSGFVLGRPILESDNACLCDLDEPYCLWSPTGLDGVQQNTPYVRLADQHVVVFETRFDTDPIGWTPCDVAPFPPPECQCAEFLPCAMQ
jgi:hypothetical protein